MARIELTDTTQSAVMKLVEGNPGATEVCLSLLTQGASIDPDAAFGGLANLLSLDTHGIYGARIWILYKHVCGEDLTAMVGTLRGCQLGIISEAALNDAIDQRGDGLDVAAVLAKVRKELPRFGATDAKAEEAQ